MELKYLEKLQLLLIMKYQNYQDLIVFKIVNTFKK